MFTIEEDVLYRVGEDGTLRIVPLTEWRERLFLEAHGGKFGAHLSDVKELGRHYWWVGHHSMDQRMCNSKYREGSETPLDLWPDPSTESAWM